MEFNERKKIFIDRWGKLSCNWGICKGMAQIHALLLISPRPLSAGCIIDELNMSSGSVNMHIRDLIDWGLVFRKQTDSRKDFFVAEKDIVLVMHNIIEHRKRKELDPIMSLLDEMDNTSATCEDSIEFTKVLSDIKNISVKVDNMMDTILRTEKNWLVNTFLRLA